MIVMFVATRAKTPRQNSLVATPNTLVVKMKESCEAASARSDREQSTILIPKATSASTFSKQVSEAFHLCLSALATRVSH